jgi:tetratricopeptide (TPR) repeat protein
MPQPAARFRPLKLPVPGRNEPCLCGSGLKYKHCCQSLAGALDFSTFNLLRYVLDNVSQKQFSALPQSHVDPLAVCDTAEQWQDEGMTNRAVKLLEPWFAKSTALSGKLDPLFDELMNCYLELRNSRKRDRLVAHVIEHGDKALRAAALQRRSTMLADQGDMVEAWNVFSQAQRMDPDNPSLAPLELTLLMSQGDADRARERARFWLARLERMRDPGLAQLINFVRSVGDDPRAAMASVERAQVPGINELEELVCAAPTVEVHYVMQDQGEGERVLQPTAALHTVEQRWYETFPQMKPSLTATQNFNDEMWNEPEAWLDFLARNPLAWQSFEVLDDLVLAVDALQIIAVSATVLEPLLARGVALVKENLGTVAHDGDGILSWGWMENRSALRLLAHKAYRAFDDQSHGVTSDDFIEHAEMLLALNPNDNHCIREPLSFAYLERGWAQKVVALTDRYPGDFCGPALNRILALVRVGREADARDELSVAAEQHEIALKMLLAKNPRPPKADNDVGITIGGREEAWMYRTSARALWERDGALDWLDKSRRRIRRQ